VTKVPTAPTPRLAGYADKRDAALSNEPPGTEPTLSGTETRAGRFVVHLHRARRTHYDLRIEVGGALKSFAVPRGPSLDPSVRRLAIETEDHPVEYLDFEAVIPEGNYGAGPMIQWDAGRVRYLERPAELGLVQGKLDMELGGFKLRGRFELVRLKARADKPSWLLFKKHDAYSREGTAVTDEDPRSVLSGLTVEELGHPEAIAAAAERRTAELGAPAREWPVRAVEPMLCSEPGRSESLEELLGRPGWVYELKLDGVRVVADKRGDQVTLWSRRGAAVTTIYPEIARAVRALPVERIVLDGEVVAFDDQGRPSFSRLGSRMHLQRPSDVWITAHECPVSYLVFDLLALGALDLTGVPLLERKAILSEVVRVRGWVRRLEHLERGGQTLYEFCRQQQLEGVVAKRGRSTYQPGPKRSGDWIKVPCERADEFVVVGLTRGRGARAALGAVDVASYEGNRLIVRGKVGSGLDARSIDEILTRTRGTERAGCAAEGELEPAPQGRSYVEPAVVISVRYLGWTQHGRLRFPVFRGFRDEVAARECRAGPARAPAAQALRAAAAEPKRVTVTHPHKVFWPNEGITKGQLCDYYAQASDVILPYLRGRPVILVRYPDGIEGNHFYQWNAPAGLPSWIRTMTLQHEGRPIEVFLVNDRDTLAYIANLGAIPIHMLAFRAESPLACDFLTLDLDVGQSTLADAIAVAGSLHALVDQVDLHAYAKTSGQSGVHVLVPLGPGVSFKTARLLVELLGRIIQRQHPTVATMQRRVEDRGPRVYIDTVQTGETRTIVAPYSVRAAPGATVSTPVTWDEVTVALDPRSFTLASVPARLAERGDPMRPMLEERPDIGRALEKLESIVRGL
jgi:bifunctional non-homologous end joining protein LigD